MPSVTNLLIRFRHEYGTALLLAVLVHGLLLTLLLNTRFSVPAQPVKVESIISFLYHPPPTNPGPVIQPPSETTMPEEVKALVEQPLAEESLLQATASDAGTPSRQPELSAQAAAVNAKLNAIQDNLPAALSPENLTQRVLNQIATPSQAAIDSDAAANYQQFLQKQQQPRLTVDKKHWPVSQDPAQQVVAQLDDGKHIVRIRKGVCVIGDPTLDGFEELMAARRVPCGDEAATNAMLKQALDKHIKR